MRSRPHPTARFTGSVLLLGIVLRAGGVHAAVVPVSYLVDAKVIRSGTVVGTPLTFALYADPACIDQVGTQVVAVESVTVLEELKAFAAKGAPRASRTARISATLTAVAAGGNVFLKVTGAGIVPVGGACQAQAAQAAPHLPIATGIVVPGDGVQRDLQIVGGSCASTGALPVERAAAANLAALDPNTRYSCRLECTHYAGPSVALYEVSGCQPIAATCSDQLKNGDETDVDCGGSCPDCTYNQGCSAASDCQSQVCTGGRCGACGIDPYCGGPCGLCGSYGLCSAPTQCQSGICQYFSGVNAFACAPARCGDGAKDGPETDVDCGGDHLGGEPESTQTCGGCAVGRACVNTRDCASGICTGNVCQ